MISCFASPCVRAQRRAILKAPSLASAPELQKNTLDANERATSAAASRSPGAVWYRLDVWISPSAAACSAALSPASS
jgi:hypothetical protein